MASGEPSTFPITIGTLSIGPENLSLISCGGAGAPMPSGEPSTFPITIGTLSTGPENLSLIPSSYKLGFSRPLFEILDS